MLGLRPAAFCRSTRESCREGVCNPAYCKLDLQYAGLYSSIDLVLTRGQRRIAVECKASTAPKANRGLRNALGDTGVDEAWIIAPVRESYPIRGGVTVAPLGSFLEAHR